MCQEIGRWRYAAYLALPMLVITEGSDSLCLWEADGLDSSKWGMEFAFPPQDNQLDDVSAVAWSPDNQKMAVIVAAQQNVQILVNDPAGTAHHLQELRATSAGTSVAWSPDGQKLAAGDANGYVTLWLVARDPRYWKKLEAIDPQGQQGRVTSVAWSPDSTKLVYALSSGVMIIWDVQLQNPLSEDFQYQGQKHMVFDVRSELAQGDALPFESFPLVSTVAWSPDSKRVAAGGSHGSSLWDVDPDHDGGWHMLESFNPPRMSSCITSVVWAPHSEVFVDGSCDGSVRVWKVGKPQPDSSSQRQSGFKMREFKNAASVNSLSWSPDGSKLTVGGVGNVSIWDIGDIHSPCSWQLLKNLQSWNTQSPSIQSVAWSKDSTQLAFAGRDLICMEPGYRVTPVHVVVAGTWFIWAVLALGLFVLMLLAAGFAARQHTDTKALAFLTVMVAVNLFIFLFVIVTVLGWIPWLRSYATFLVPQLLPFLLHFVANAAGYVTSFLRHACHGLFSLSEWLHDAWELLYEIVHCKHVYKLVVPDLTYGVAEGARLPLRYTEPLIGTPVEGPSLESSAIALRDYVGPDSEFGFADAAAYERLEERMSQPCVATIKEMCGFVKLYAQGLRELLPKSFKRRIWLRKSLKAIKQQYRTIEDDSRYRWMVLADQFEWYEKHDLYLADVLALVVNSDEGAHVAPVLRLWAAVDYALSFAPRLIFSPMWVPSPKSRMADLNNRRQMIQHLSEGLGT